MFGRQQPRGTAATTPILLTLVFVRRAPVLALLLASGLPARLVAHTLIVGFSPHRRFQRELLEVTDYRVPVEEELSRTFGVPLAVTTALQPTRPSQRRDHEGTLLRG